MLEWKTISSDEWESIAPPKKASKWDNLLDEIEKGTIIKLPTDASEKRGYRIGIARAAKSRGYKVEFREDAGFLAMRQGEDVSDKPKRRAKATSPVAEPTGEVKKRGRPRKSQPLEQGKE